MTQSIEPITKLDEAARYVEEAVRSHPERDRVAAVLSAMAGCRRSHSVLSLNHLAVPGDNVCLMF